MTSLGLRVEVKIELHHSGFIMQPVKRALVSGTYVTIDRREIGQLREDQ